VSNNCALSYPKVGQWLDTYVITANGLQGCSDVRHVIALPRRALHQGQRSISAQVVTFDFDYPYLCILCIK
jgi:hypothetical protein